MATIDLEEEESEADEFVILDECTDGSLDHVTGKVGMADDDTPKELKTFFIKVPKVNIEQYGGSVSNSRQNTATCHRKAMSREKRRLNRMKRREKLRALGVTMPAPKNIAVSFSDGFRIPQRTSSSSLSPPTHNYHNFFQEQFMKHEKSDHYKSIYGGERKCTTIPLLPRKRPDLSVANSHKKIKKDKEKSRVHHYVKDNTVYIYSDTSSDSSALPENGNKSDVVKRVPQFKYLKSNTAKKSAPPIKFNKDSKSTNISALFKPHSNTTVSNSSTAKLQSNAENSCSSTVNSDCSAMKSHSNTEKSCSNTSDSYSCIVRSHSNTKKSQSKTVKSHSNTKKSHIKKYHSNTNNSHQGTSKHHSILLNPHSKLKKPHSNATTKSRSNSNKNKPHSNTERSHSNTTSEQKSESEINNTKESGTFDDQVSKCNKVCSSSNSKTSKKSILKSKKNRSAVSMKTEVTLTNSDQLPGGTSRKRLNMTKLNKPSKKKKIKLKRKTGNSNIENVSPKEVEPPNSTDVTEDMVTTNSLPTDKNQDNDDITCSISIDSDSLSDRSLNLTITEKSCGTDNMEKEGESMSGQGGEKEKDDLYKNMLLESIKSLQLELEDVPDNEEADSVPILSIDSVTEDGDNVGDKKNIGDRVTKGNEIEVDTGDSEENMALTDNTVQDEVLSLECMEDIGVLDGDERNTDTGDERVNNSNGDKRVNNSNSGGDERVNKSDVGDERVDDGDERVINKDDGGDGHQRVNNSNNDTPTACVDEDSQKSTEVPAKEDKDNTSSKRKKVRIADEAEVIGIDLICDDNLVPIQLQMSPVKSVLKNSHEKPVLKKVGKYSKKKRKELIRHLKNCKNQEKVAKNVEGHKRKVLITNKKRKTEQELLYDINSSNFPDSVRRERAPSLKAIEALVSNKIYAQNTSSNRSRKRKQNITLLKVPEQEAKVRKKRKIVDRSIVEGKTINKMMEEAHVADNEDQVEMSRKQLPRWKRKKRRPLWPTHRICRSQGCQVSNEVKTCHRISQKTPPFYQPITMGPVPQETFSVQVNKRRFKGVSEWESSYGNNSSDTKHTAEYNHHIWVMADPAESCSRCIHTCIVMARLLKPCGPPESVDVSLVPSRLTQQFKILYSLSSKLNQLNYEHFSKHHVGFLFVALLNLQNCVLPGIALGYDEIVQTVESSLTKSCGNAFYTLGLLLIEIHTCLVNINELVKNSSEFKRVKNLVEVCLLVTLYLRMYIGNHCRVSKTFMDCIQVDKVGLVKMAAIDPRSFVFYDHIPFSEVLHQCKEKIEKAEENLDTAYEKQFNIYKDFVIDLAKQCKSFDESSDQATVCTSARTHFSYEEIMKQELFISERALKTVEAKKSFIRTATSLDVLGMELEASPKPQPLSLQTSESFGVLFSPKERSTMKLIHKIIMSKLSSMIHRYKTQTQTPISPDRMQEMMSILFQHYFKRIQTQILRSYLKDKLNQLGMPFVMDQIDQPNNQQSSSSDSAALSGGVSGQVDLPTIKAHSSGGLTDISKMISAARQCINRLSNQRGQSTAKSSVDVSTTNTMVSSSVANALRSVISHPSPLMDLIRQHRNASQSTARSSSSSISTTSRATVSNTAPRSSSSTPISSTKSISNATTLKTSLASTPCERVPQIGRPTSTSLTATPTVRTNWVSTSTPRVTVSKTDPPILTSTTATPTIRTNLVSTSTPRVTVSNTDPPILTSTTATPTVRTNQISNSSNAQLLSTISSKPSTSFVGISSLAGKTVGVAVPPNTIPPQLPGKINFGVSLPSITQFLNQLSFLNNSSSKSNTLESNEGASISKTTANVTVTTSDVTIATNNIVTTDVSMATSDVTIATNDSMTTSNVTMTTNDTMVTKDVAMTTNVNTLTNDNAIATVALTTNHVTMATNDVTSVRPTLFLSNLRNPSKAVYVQSLTQHQSQSIGPSCKPTIPIPLKGLIPTPQARNQPQAVQKPPPPTSTIKTPPTCVPIALPTNISTTLPMCELMTPPNCITMTPPTFTTNTSTISECRMTRTPTPQEVLSQLTQHLIHRPPTPINARPTSVRSPRESISHLASLLSSVYSNIRPPGVVPLPRTIVPPVVMFQMPRPLQTTPTTSRHTVNHISTKVTQSQNTPFSSQTSQPTQSTSSLSNFVKGGLPGTEQVNKTDQSKGPRDVVNGVTFNYSNDTVKSLHDYVKSYNNRSTIRAVSSGATTEPNNVQIYRIQSHASDHLSLAGEGTGEVKVEQIDKLQFVNRQSSSSDSSYIVQVSSEQVHVNVPSSSDDHEPSSSIVQVSRDNVPSSSEYIPSPSDQVHVNVPSSSNDNCKPSSSIVQVSSDSIPSSSNLESQEVNSRTKISLSARVVDQSIILQWDISLKPNSSPVKAISKFEICYAKLPDKSHFTFEGCCNASWSCMGAVKALALPMSATLANLQINQCYLFIIKGVLATGAVIYSDIKLVLVN